ncbi:MAG: hypothetical protein J6V99_06065 [Neisseriaceae bacterium]|nr:hypothetical protein [Neisseriaceae bacterium]
MSFSKDMADIYTKSSVYYLRLQYLVICYLIVLLLAAFVLPLPRTYGLNGGLRLFVGLALYAGFAVLMTYSPKFLHSSAGKYLSPDEYEEELTKKLKQIPSKHQVELEEKILARKQAKFKIIATQNDSTVSKKQGIAAVIYFQCLLFELFCVAVLVNQNDGSLLISNPVTQGIANFLSNFTDSDPSGFTYRDEFFVVYDKAEEFGPALPFSKFAHMSECVFFLYLISMASFIARTVSMFIMSRPILVRSDVVAIIKNAKTIKKFIWAVFGTLVCIFAAIALVYGFLEDLGFYVAEIEHVFGWFRYSVLWFSFASIWFAITWRFMEDWYKLIFRKF